LSKIIIKKQNQSFIKKHVKGKKKKKGVHEAHHAPAAHNCNSSYLEGGDREDCSSKPALANSSLDPISKTRKTKTGYQSGPKARAPSKEAQGPESKPQRHQNKQT
jgi:hypothetical protein